MLRSITLFGKVHLTAIIPKVGLLELMHGCWEAIMAAKVDKTSRCSKIVYA